MPSGTATGSWTGSGVFGEINRHSGKLALEESRLDFPGRPPMAGNLRASYDWPGKLHVDLLQIEQQGRTLELSGSWSDGQVTLPALSLVEGEQTLLRGRARLPMSPELRSLDDFLAQDGPISATLQADDLSLAQLRDLLPGVELPASGLIRGTAGIGGTLAAPVVEAALDIREVTVRALPDLEPTDITLTLNSANGRIDIVSRLVQNGEELLDIVADLPISPAIRSLDDFLAQEEEISVRMETTDFSVAQLQQFLPPDFAELPPVGKIDGELNISGTFAKPTMTTTITVREISFRLPEGLPLAARP